MYNSKEYVESKNATPGTVTTGVIINLTDGKVKDFIKNEEAKSKFKNLESNAINLTIEFLHENSKLYIERLFSYNEQAGKIILKQSSKLGKYKKFYSKLPEIGDQVKLVSNAEGYFNLMI